MCFSDLQIAPSPKPTHRPMTLSGDALQHPSRIIHGVPPAYFTERSSSGWKSSGQQKGASEVRLPDSEANLDVDTDCGKLPLCDDSERCCDERDAQANRLLHYQKIAVQFQKLDSQPS